MGNTNHLSKINYVDQTGKVIIITGGNTGLGYINARECLRMGAHVIIACRNKERAEEAMSKMRKEIEDNAVDGIEIGIVEFMLLDFASLSSIREFVKNFKEETREEKNLPLHVLVNNAGVFGSSQRTETVDGLEMHFGTNHIGPFLLTSSH